MISPQWVDYHCHLDLYHDHGVVAAECERLGILTFAMTTTPKAWERNRRFADRFTMIRVGLGLHPQVVAERAHELNDVLPLLPETDYVGEIGLDASPAFYSSFAAQERVFTSVLSACSKLGPKIFSVHSVRSASRVMTHVERLLDPNRSRVVLHWFSGSVAELRRAVTLGCYFSVNSAMLGSSRGLSLIKQMPRERVITETDGPFVKTMGIPARPSHIPTTVHSLAQAWGEKDDAVAQRVLFNVQELERIIEPKASLQSVDQ